MSGLKSQPISTWQRRSSFPGLVPLNDMVNSKSVVGIKSGDSSALIGYQLYESTCIWSAQYFVQ